jgi:hypothetical protein
LTARGDGYEVTKEAAAVGVWAIKQDILRRAQEIRP